MLAFAIPRSRVSRNKLGLFMNIILILLSVLLNCAAQLLIRKGMLIEGEVGMQNMLSHVGSMLTNLWLWGAMFCFLGSILLWVVVLSRVEVSYAYVFNSIGYVVLTVCAYWLFDESMSIYKIVGMAVVILGLIIMSLHPHF